LPPASEYRKAAGIITGSHPGRLRPVIIGRDAVGLTIMCVGPVLVYLKERRPAQGKIGSFGCQGSPPPCQQYDADHDDKPFSPHWLLPLVLRGCRRRNRTAPWPDSCSP